MSAFLNRLRKRKKHLGKWARRWPTQAYRVYDRDIPDYPWSVDVYHDAIFLQEYPKYHTDIVARKKQREEVIAALMEVFGLARADIFMRTRSRQAGTNQYERSHEKGSERRVKEGDHTFLVNLEEYIDTGLFLDHRNLRREVARRVGSMPGTPRMLNLFCYTGAFSVWAARAGAHTTSVDLSNTYLDWTRRNLEANQINPQQHILSRSDILRWLPREVELGRSYDVIVLDPPTFSRSKKMERDLDIQRDHPLLITHCLSLLSPQGVLFFSTNFRDFELAPKISARALEISHQTVPDDFRKGIHRAWEFCSPI